MDSWTRNEVAKKLWRLSRLDISLAPDYISQVDPILYHAALFFFSDWVEALEAVGQNYPRADSL
jgi:hypothetical protein